MKILVINGPNLNMLGIREVGIYGSETYSSLVDKIKDYAKERKVEVECKQSNSEGEIVTFIQNAYFLGFACMFQAWILYIFINGFSVLPQCLQFLVAFSCWVIRDVNPIVIELIYQLTIR